LGGAAQLLSLGHIMRAAYFTRLALIIGWQAGMIAAVFYINLKNAESLFFVSATLLPFIGYYWAFYDAPAFANWSRVKRAAILTLSFVFATVVGFAVLFYLELLIAFRL
jgi:hypothetical protein